MPTVTSFGINMQPLPFRLHYTMVVMVVAFSFAAAHYSHCSGFSFSWT